MRHKFVVTAFFAAAILVSPACGGGSKSGILRFVHAFGDLGGIDVLFNDQVVAQDVRFGTSSEYLSANSDSVIVKLRKTGTSTIVLSPSISLPKSAEVTLVGEGKENPGAGEPALETRAFNDDRSEPEEGKFELRIIHSSAENSGTVDIFVVNTNQDQNSGGVSATFLNLDFGQATNFVQRDAGSKRIIVTQSGNKNNEFYDSGSDTFDLASKVKRTLVLVDGNVPGNMSRPVVLADRN